MHPKLTDSRLGNVGARAIHAGFITYRTRFKEITRRAETRFKKRDWHGMQADAGERLDLYPTVVDRIETEIRRLLGDRLSDRLVWASLKAVYSSLLDNHEDWELAETFFNSVTRRIFATIGVDPQIEFVSTDFETPPTPATSKAYRSYGGGGTLVDLIRDVLADCPLRDDFQDVRRDVGLAAAAVEAHISGLGPAAVVERVDTAENVFYRGKGAYIIGRLHNGALMVPLVMALLNTPDGIVIDSVLLEEDDVSVLFSFARSYFHVEVDRPYDLIRFLKTIIPKKRVAELYISTGFNKHGKTELYRDFLHHLTVCQNDRFEIARGQRGMVMIVFNMPNDDLVFKLIRDRFDTPKKTTRQEVMEKYDLVFKHDRAGRLVDAQAFEQLKFNACSFSPPLLEELQRHTPHTVRSNEDHVIIDHAYVERRVIPLDLYLQEADEAAARRAVIDFGHAIKDLAVSNIFPGDLLLKNFGVTRHGRVVFYDYDELCLLTSCNFRKLPRAARDENELAAEPWFYIDENDVFPEEFRNFLGLPRGLRDVFMAHHSDLLDVDFWRRAQDAIKAGELPFIFPYPRRRQLQKLKNSGHAEQDLGP
ncbi:MAG: bifunctional isocitrate dehydrogenase kinase/phosphatase [Desulfobacterales bacterium]|nr:MAG: bifunctional isocitrate dehydrogenase kinase/phosphatase [Desulfobacterales bacterium]